MPRAPAVVRAVVFDFDGVIADTEPLHYASFARTMAEVDIHISRAEADRHFLGVDDRTCFEKAYAMAGRVLAESERERLVERKSELYLEGLVDVELFAGARGVIEAAAGRSPIGIVSGGFRKEILAVLDRHDAAQPFRFIVSADERLPSKPDPAGYLRAVDTLREILGAPVDAGECLAVEDSPRGVAAAKAAGMRCVAVTHTFPAAGLGAADRVLDRLDELLTEWE